MLKIKREIKAKEAEMLKIKREIKAKEKPTGLKAGWLIVSVGNTFVRIRSYSPLLQKW